jgi:alanyl-tRNA synthetase
MQQHTGQHILSQAFINLFNAPTKSFRVLENVCEIDVELANPTPEVIERAVELANNVVWEDRAITIHHVTAERAAVMPLRKESSREGELRLIEIEGFDLTPCGGTHAYRTGEVGMIVMRSWERAKGLVRIEFAAGMRALADYRKANKSARDVAALLSCGRDDVGQHAAQLLEEGKELRRQVRALEEVAAGVEATKLWSAVTPREDGTRIVVQVFGVGAGESSGSGQSCGSGESAVSDAEFLKKIAHALMAHPRTIALLGLREKEAAKVVFARSADATGDMNALMREACALLDGRGGGRPDMAQGGGKNSAKLSEAIERAAELVNAR